MAGKHIKSAGVARPSFLIVNKQARPDINSTKAPVDLQKMVVTNKAKTGQPAARFPMCVRAPVNHIQIAKSEALVIHMPSIRPLAMRPWGRHPPSRVPEEPP